MCSNRDDFLVLWWKVHTFKQWDFLRKGVIQLLPDVMHDSLILTLLLTHFCFSNSFFAWLHIGPIRSGEQHNPDNFHLFKETSSIQHGRNCGYPNPNAGNSISIFEAVIYLVSYCLKNCFYSDFFDCFDLFEIKATLPHLHATDLWRHFPFRVSSHLINHSSQEHCLLLEPKPIQC